ncbi:MAG: ABC transporter transmembrane domain-containing protein, partial [Burkholderiaceae bacterium]
MNDRYISSNVQTSALRRLAQRLRSYGFALALAVICFACIAITEMLLPALMKPLLDNGFAGTHPHYVWQAPLVIVGIFVVRGIFTFTSHYVLAWVSNRMLLDLRSEMFSQLLKLPDTYFKKTPASETLNRFLGDAQNALSLAAETASLAVRDTFVIIALLGYLLYLNWQLTFVALAIIPLAAIVTRLFAKRMTIIARSTQEMNIELTQSVLEGNDAQRVIKLYGGYDYEKSRFDAVNARLRRLAMRNVIAGAATVPTTQIIASVGVAIVVAIALTQ